MSENTIKKIWISLLALYSLIILFYTGFGLQGQYILISGLPLLLYTVVSLRHKAFRQIAFRDFFVTGFKFIIIAILALYWLTLSDYFYVELFKILGYNFADNTYWVVNFGILIPVLVILMTVIYFLTTHKLTNTLKIVISSSFIFNSNLNDIFYYKVFGDSLPSQWPWLIQPKFIFGDPINSTEVYLWIIFCLSLSIITWLAPFGSSKTHKNNPNTNHQISDYLILLTLVVMTITITPHIVDIIQNSLIFQSK